MAEVRAGPEVAGTSGDIPGTSAEIKTAGGPQTQAVGAAPLPYPPSWVDKFTDWVRRLPMPAWVFYLAVVILSAVVLLPLDALSPEIVLSSASAVYVFALVHYLDDWATAALKRFRSIMTVDDAEYERLCYRFTTMPRRPVLIATVIGAIYATIAFLTFGASDPSVSGETASTSVFEAIPLIYSYASYTVVGLLIYHTIHQLRLMNEIYTHHTRINLFQRGPMYALSRLAARTSIGISIPTFLWFQLVSSSEEVDYSAAFLETAFFGTVILLTFIWPLLGAHSLLDKEKERLKDQLARRVEATIIELQSRVDSGDYQGRDALRDTMEGLVASQSVIDKLRTWPWQTQTISGVGAAFLLPLFIWFIQRMLERLGV
ncbi:MAG: hypothetical protein M3437_19920 [Chloroflexota bacterium]|nr:hypothetical protein [Chloroflexota bacterium]MDQ5866022.1 hypothetical protein [Chloroflexota bacterium]